MAANLKLDTFGMSLVLDGFTPVEGYWNGRHAQGGGWACPMFTKAQADQVMAQINVITSSHPLHYAEQADQYYTLPFRDGDDGEVFESFDAVIDGQPVRLYDFGGWCFDVERA